MAKIKDLPIRKVPSKNYRQIIEVRVPVRFYWTEEGFDGIEIGPVHDGLSEYCGRLAVKVLNEIGGLLSSLGGDTFTVRPVRQKRHKTPIPRVFRDAFREKR